MSDIHGKFFSNFSKRCVLKCTDIKRKFNGSQDNPYIFIHINKTGGSSVEEALKLPREHKTALEKREEVGLSKWEERKSFCIVRNPWDKVVSHYHYRVQTNQTGLGDKHIDFKEWVEQVFYFKNIRYLDKVRMFSPQLSWVSDNGDLIVDKVFKFEDFAIELPAYLTQEFDIDVHLPHVKSSKREKYNVYYDDRTAALVHEWYKPDIELFGFEFHEDVLEK